MAQAWDFYCNDIHDQFGLFANWPPNQTLALGDYGIMQDNWFRRIGNITDPGVGLSFKIVTDPTQAADYNYQTAGSTNVSASASGSGTAGVPVKASISITFSSETSDFIVAAACVPSMIEDQATLGDQILQLYDQGKWDFDYAIVTGLLSAGATTVILSAGSTASITIEADSSAVKSINLADASASLTVTYQNNVGIQAIAKSGLNPFISLSKVQHQFLFLGIKFGPYSDVLFEATLKSKQISPDGKSKGRSPHFFGSLR